MAPWGTAVEPPTGLATSFFQYGIWGYGDLAATDGILGNGVDEPDAAVRTWAFRYPATTSELFFSGYLYGQIAEAKFFLIYLVVG